jgi:hypothetical protein
MNVTGTMAGSVWGTDVYTSDGSLGKTAIHAGLLTTGQTKYMRVCMRPGRSSYTGSTRNGVTSYSYGAFGSSISLVADPGAEAGAPPTPGANDYKAAVLDDDPIAYWRKYSGGAIADASGNGFNITSGNIGADLSASGYSPIAGSTDPASLYFAGNTSNNGVITPLTKGDFSNWDTGWSWGFWAKTEKLTGSWNPGYSGVQAQAPLMIGNADGFSPSYHAYAQLWRNQKFQFWHSHGSDENTNPSSPAATINTWHYFNLVAEEGSAKFYVDGSLVTDYTSDTPDIADNTPFTFSTYMGDDWPTGNFDSLRGKIAEVAVYDHELTQEQITRQYRLGKYGLHFSYPDQTVWARDGQSTFWDSYGGPIANLEPDIAGSPTGWSFAVAPGYTLPGGLTVNSATGEISGTVDTDNVNTQFVEIRVKATKGANTITSNLVTIVVRPSTIAAQFRPFLRFDEGEDWRPLSVDAFLSETYPGDDTHQICPDKSDPGVGCHDWSYWGTHELSFPHPTLLDDEAEWPYIDFHGEGDEVEHLKAPDADLVECDAGYLYDCDTGPTSVMYWHNAPTTSAYNLLDYWTFYRYNKYDGGFYDGDHEADWEEVVVAYTGSNPQTFDWVGMSAHGPVYRYLRGVLTCGGAEAEPGSCGTEGSPANDVFRPHVFVADGSHANYPEECSYGGLLLCAQPEEVWPEKDHGGEDPWGNNDNASSLKLFNDEAGWDGFTGDWWADWNGWWGYQDDESHVTSPGASNRSPDIYNNSDGSADDIPCNELGSDEEENCSEPLSRILGLPSVPLSGSSSACAPWMGPGIVVSICNPQLLGSSLETGKLDLPAEVHISNLGRDRVIDGAPGIIQVLGKPLQAGDALEIRGELRGMTIKVETSLGQSMGTSAQFSDITGGKGITLSVRPDGDPILRLPDGGRMQPDSVSLRRQ